MSSRRRSLGMALLATFGVLALSSSAASAEGTGSVSGTLTDSDGHPVQSACVRAYDATEHQVSFSWTDADGHYLLEGLDSGDFRVQFTSCDANVIEEYYDGKASFTEATPVSVTDGSDTPGIDAQLEKGGSISGKVTIDTTGPRPEICVSLDGIGLNWGGSARVLSDGRYSVDGLKTGSYRVEFRGCGAKDNVAREFYPDKGTYAEAGAVPVTQGSDTSGIDAELAVGGSITGTYSIESSAAPVFCGGSASVYDSSGSQVNSVAFPPGTGVHATYRLNQLKTGDYRVGFELGCRGELDPGLLFSSVSFYRGKGSLADATPIHVTEGSVRTGINSLSDGGASISGTVTDRSGRPLGDICVDTYDEHGNLGNFGRTGPDGSYLIDQFTAGDYRLEFSGCGGPDSSVVPEFYDDKGSLEEAVPVSLAQGAAISGIDAQLETQPRHGPGPGPGQVAKARISKLSVKGPIKTRKGRKTTHRARITNSGNANAIGVRLKVNGRGVRLNASVGTIPANATKTVRVKLRPKKRGKSKLTFTVTSSNAGGKTVKRRITVRK